MSLRRAVLPVICLLALSMHLSAGAKARQKEAEEGPRVESTLRHVDVQPVVALPMFAAGVSGNLQLRISLPQGHRWDPRDPGPNIAVVAPEESGVRFAPGNRDLSLPKDLSGVIIANVPYTVSSRVRVKSYSVRCDLRLALVAADGTRIQDAGTATLPVRVDTPLRTKIMVLVVIALAIFLFVVEWVRVDVVAMMMMVALPLLNLLSSRATFTGLSSNAVVAIIGVMIVSAGLNRVGLVSRMVKPVINLAGKSPSRLIVFLGSLIALISSVMQNTGAAVLFLPGIRHACKVMRLPISRVLMPIGMCAILGGTLTMIGTSPLILLNDILPEGVNRFGLLELAPIGLGLVIVGLLYFATGGKFFLERISRAQQARLGGGQPGEQADGNSYYHELEGPFELTVPDGWEQKSGRPETVVAVRHAFEVHIIAVADRRGFYSAAPPLDFRLSAGLSLCVYGAADAVRAFAERYGLAREERPRLFRELFNPAVAGTVEAVVTPHSGLIGRSIGDVHFRKSFGVTPLALFREGRTYYKEQADIPLLAGDAILLHGTWEQIEGMQESHRNLITIAPLDVEIQKPSKAKVAVACFLVTLTMMLVSSFYYQQLPYNPMPLSVCLMAGAVGMVVTGVLSIRDAYAAVDWRTVFLLGGLIPLGMAVDRTGTAEWMATEVVGALGDSVTPLVLLTVLGLMSSAFCLVISNVGACTLLVPLAASMATQIGIDPRVAAIVVGIGVSNSFLLPTHQVNALYMGPGDYRTKDYMKIGGVLSLLYAAVLISMTYLFYL